MTDLMRNQDELDKYKLKMNTFEKTITAYRTDYKVKWIENY